MAETPTRQLAEEHEYVLLVVGAMAAEADFIERTGTSMRSAWPRWSISRATSQTAIIMPKRRTSSSRSSRSGVRPPAGRSACC